MEYKRYKPKYERPFGMGPFFDYGVAMAKHLESQSLRARRKKSVAAPQPQQSVEERWDAEGGNSQTPIARRAAWHRR